MVRILIVVLLSVSLSGCATIMTGIYQKVPVSSVPDGVTFQVDGKDFQNTPVKVRLRRYRDHVLTFTKDGYKSQTIKLLHVMSGAFCGNVFLGGPVGMAIDSWSGAQFKLVPGSVHVEMEKDEK